MRHNAIFSLLVLVLTLGMVSCNKSNEDINPAPEKEPVSEMVYTLSVTATKALDTKALDGNMNATWGDSDKVEVYFNDSHVGTLTPETSGSPMTRLTGGLIFESAPSVGDELDLVFPRATRSYAGQKGTIADIAANYDYALATVSITSVRETGISANNANFENQQAIIKFNLKNTSDDAIKASSLSISTTSGKLVSSYNDGIVVYGDLTVSTETEGGVSTYYVALRNDSATSDLYSLTATVGNETYYYRKSDVTFANGKYYEINVKMYVGDTFTIAGTSNVFGSDWDETDVNNDMELSGEEGVFRKIYHNVTAGTTISFKIVKNHDWSNGSWPGDDYSYVTGAGDLIISYNAASNNVSAEMSPSLYTVAGRVGGDDSKGGFFGSPWDKNGFANDMTKHSYYNSFYKLYPSTSFTELTNVDFKVVGNRSWDTAYPSSNYNITVADGGTLYVLFFPDESNKVEAITTLTIAGNNTDILGDSWKADASDNDMLLQEDGTFIKEYVLSLSSTSNFEFKVAYNHAWGISYGDGSENYSVELGSSSKKLTITYNPHTHIISTDVETE